MTDFVLITWDADCETPSRIGAHLRSTRAWTLAHQGRGIALWVSCRRPLSIWVDPDERWILIGDLFGVSPATAAGATPAQTARRLLDTAWGRYVAIFRDTAGGLQAVFRDPSSTLDVVVWRCEGAAIAASDLSAGLLTLAPGLEPDWDLVGAAMIDPLRFSGHTAVRGLESVTPGALRTWQGGGSRESLLWRPATFARRCWPDSVETRAELVARVERSIQDYCSLGGGLVAELSGGLDSSTVAAALIRCPSAKVLQWLHYYIDDPAGDERPYARAMAAKLGVHLTEAHKPPGRLDHAAISDFALGAKPSWRVVDGDYDRDLARRVSALGATRVMTGLGGDTIYMQGGDRWLGVEALGAGALWRLPGIARFAKRSVWEIAAKGLAGMLGAGPSLQPLVPSFASEKARNALTSQPGHPWLEDLQGVTPAKQQQILGLAHTLLIHGRSRRSRAADIVSPLMSQPVVEFCLGLSALAQTGGGDDRLMARTAFGDRLAPEILARRSKAGYGAYYGRMLAQDLGQMRSLLLEGQLADAGLLDLGGLDQILTHEALIRNGPYREVLNLVILEYWARSWRAVS